MLSGSSAAEAAKCSAELEASALRLGLTSCSAVLDHSHELGSPTGCKYNHCVYLLYSMLLLLALIVAAPWWMLEMVRHGKYRRGWGERWGRVPARLHDPVTTQCIWVHAVSVGEVLAISRVLENLTQQLPGWRIVVSTTTDTGQNLAREHFGEANVFYFPLDLPFAFCPYLEILRPRMLILAESEFWPNLLRRARCFGAAVAVVNARISDRSFPRYVRFKNFMRPVLSNVHLFLAQTEEDGRRLVAMGAPDDRVQVSGNLKFETRTPALSNTAILFKAAISREQITPLLVAGSTLDGEEEMLLGTFRAVVNRYGGATLLLAPRHPERFAAVRSLLAKSGLPFQLRSEWDGSSAIAGRVVLLDSIGELAGVYVLADLAFIGGSLVPRGGHNVLEAARFGVPILVGPHTENFRDIVQVFREADALRVATPQSLTATVLHLLEDHEQRASLGQRAAGVMRAQQGATARTVRALLELLHETPAVLAGQPVTETRA